MSEIVQVKRLAPDIVDLDVKELLTWLKSTKIIDSTLPDEDVQKPSNYGHDKSEHIKVMKSSII